MLSKNDGSGLKTTSRGERKAFLPKPLLSASSPAGTGGVRFLLSDIES
jgi:hypothetical protein